MSGGGGETVLFADRDPNVTFALATLVAEQDFDGRVQREGLDATAVREAARRRLEGHRATIDASFLGGTLAAREEERH